MIFYFIVVNVANVQHSTRLLAATTLCNILGTKTLQEILQDKGTIQIYLPSNNKQLKQQLIFTLLRSSSQSNAGRKILAIFWRLYILFYFLNKIKRS